jgi:hypothetical protein
MFRSNWNILRELMLTLAKATIMWSWPVKIHRYMICGVVATSISGCGVCTACRVVWDFFSGLAHYLHRVLHACQHLSTPTSAVHVLNIQLKQYKFKALTTPRLMGCKNIVRPDGINFKFSDKARIQAHLAYWHYLKLERYFNQHSSLLIK